MSGDLLKATAHESLVHNLQIRTVTPAPAAGAEIVITVPSPEVWRIKAVRATLVTSAVVANRNPTLVVDDQTNIGAQVAGAFALAASTTTVVNFVADFGSGPTTTTGGVAIVSMPGFVLPTGYRLRTITGLIDVADQWSAITVMIERMDEPPYRVPLVGTALDDDVEHELMMRNQGG